MKIFSKTFYLSLFTYPQRSNEPLHFHSRNTVFHMQYSLVYTSFIITFLKHLTLEKYLVTHIWKILRNSSLHGKTHTNSSRGKVAVTKITKVISITSVSWKNRELLRLATAKSPATKRLFPWSYNCQCSIVLNKNYTLVAFSFSKHIYRETSKDKWFQWHLFCQCSWLFLVLEQANCGRGIIPRHIILDLSVACRLWFGWPYLGA